jgi:RNA polymerase sigma-70 factor (ECF subfamily)
MTDPLQLRLLVLRCQTGDEAAFAELVELVGPRLRYFLRKMLPDPQSADDALQDVWVDVVRSIHRLADAGAFVGWAYRIARVRAAREFRQPRPPHRTLLEADLVEEPDESWSAEDADRVHAALDGLTAEHREVLLLRFLEGMSYEDIAGVVGGPVGTVRSRIHYAKGALRRALEQGHHHDRSGAGPGAAGG